MERLIEYYLTDHRINVFIVSPDDPSPHALSLAYHYGKLAELVASLRRHMWRHEDSNALADALDKSLLEPLRQLGLIDDEDVLCIAPHRCLHAVPFGALGTPGRRAVMRNPIVQVPTGAALPALLRPASPPTGRSVV